MLGEWFSYSSDIKVLSRVIKAQGHLRPRDRERERERFRVFVLILSFIYSFVYLVSVDMLQKLSKTHRQNLITVKFCLNFCI